MTILWITCILCGIEKKEADEEGKGKYQEMLKTKAIEHKNVNKTTKSAYKWLEMFYYTSKEEGECTIL